MRRLVLVVVASSFLLAPSTAGAQSDWLPCSLRYPGGGGLGANRSSPSAAQFIGGQAGAIYFEASLIGSGAGFDRFDGADIPEISAQSVALGLSARFAERWTLDANIPYFSVEDDAPGAGDASGMGDIAVGASVAIGPECKNEDGSCGGFSLSFGGTLPTGDEDENLGYGEPTLRAGVDWARGADTNGASFAWAVPRWLFSAGVGYGHNFVDSDLSTIAAFLSFEGARYGKDDSAAFVYAVGMRSEWEVSGDVDVGPGMTREAIHDLEAAVSLGATFARQKWQIMLTGRFALSDDGLQDEFIPMLTVSRRVAID